MVRALRFRVLKLMARTRWPPGGRRKVGANAGVRFRELRRFSQKLLLGGEFGYKRVVDASEGGLECPGRGWIIG